MRRVTTDVAVVGAGPAGSTFATRMAQLGFDVCLIERTPFPRRHLGESLSPGVMPLLATVGSDAYVAAANHIRVSAVRTNWDGAETVRHDAHAQGMLVDRGAFDAALLARAHAVGVQVLHPAHVREHVCISEGWRLHVDGPDESIDLRAHYLAHASGRSARVGGRRRAMGQRTIAIHAYWTGTRLPEQPRIEAGEREWFWGVPLPDGTYNTLVFVDGERFRAERHGSLDHRLRALLTRSSLMRETRGVALVAPVRATDATAYVDEECVSARHIKIGDAALALDPLSSSGVQKAIQTALSGAIVVNTLLRRPAAREAALQFYRDSVHDAAARHRVWASSHYATAAARFDDPFWNVRAAVGASLESDAVARPAPAVAVEDDIPVRLSPDATWHDLPCLGDRFVELRPVLRHPQLDGAVAYLGGHDLAPLLRQARAGMTSRELAVAWSGSMPAATALSIARWLTEHGVLERCTAVAP
ncbi:MAG TPA: NAD(P)/FAD-dependent oxidoreductase [Gemmatimonadaceae bacterium]|jgi:flavin-dependent dehydrogenase|nr:NAD(P)/FAD-dependent oxidoreductase [Gemmatimonadaceae bacterium]